MLIDGDYIVVLKIRLKTPPESIRLLKMTHEIEDNMLGKAEFIFENHDNRLESRDLREFMSEGNVIEFRYGYINDLSRKYTYLMQGFEGYKELKVTCYPYVHKGDETITRTFDNKTYSEVAEILIKEMKLKPVITKTKEKVKSIKLNNESRLKWLSKIAKKLHFEFGLTGSNIVWRERNYKAKPRFGFIYEDTRIIGNILDFNPNKNLFQIPDGYVFVDTDVKTGKTLQIGASNDTTKRAVLGGSKSAISAGASSGVSNPSGDKQKQKKEVV